MDLVGLSVFSEYDHCKDERHLKYVLTVIAVYNVTVYVYNQVICTIT